MQCDASRRRGRSLVAEGRRPHSPPAIPARRCRPRSVLGPAAVVPLGAHEAARLGAPLHERRLHGLRRRRDAQPRLGIRRVRGRGAVRRSGRGDAQAEGAPPSERRHARAAHKHDEA
eukprot:1493866-Prymnesium_polylepis.2